uniref:Uncharacterized protein n=1 Tax=Anabas testudineus TaxID=64144 RepID=A0A7N6AFQ2_ANATE
MSSPRLGVVRDSMLTNPLHIKASLGKSRSRGLSIPGPDFTFGTSSSSLKDGGVAEAVFLSQFCPTGGSNFVSLNRDAVKSGLVTSKELSQYRAQRAGGPRTKGPDPRRQEASRGPAVPDMTFGVTTRTSPPGSGWINGSTRRRPTVCVT